MSGNRRPGTDVWSFANVTTETARGHTAMNAAPQTERPAGDAVQTGTPQSEPPTRVPRQRTDVRRRLMALRRW